MGGGIQPYVCFSICLVDCIFAWAPWPHLSMADKGTPTRLGEAATKINSGWDQSISKVAGQQQRAPGAAGGRGGPPAPAASCRLQLLTAPQGCRPPRLRQHRPARGCEARERKIRRHGTHVMHDRHVVHRRPSAGQALLKSGKGCATHLPRATSWQMTSMTAVVLPVPGGPAQHGREAWHGGCCHAREAATGEGAGCRQLFTAQGRAQQARIYTCHTPHRPNRQRPAAAMCTHPP